MEEQVDDEPQKNIDELIEKERTIEYWIGKLPVRVHDMMILPDSSRFARAVFDLQVGFLNLRECWLLGTSYDSPWLFNLGFPGKRQGKTKNSKWIVLVDINDEVVKKAAKYVAISRYLELIENDVQQVANKMMEVSGLLDE